MERSIIQKWWLPASPEVVWDYLTKPELLEQWLMENDIKPVVGHQFKFRTYPKVNFGFDGIVYCEVLVAEPFKKLSYSWKGGPGKGKINLDTVVTWTLEEKDGGTQLLLEHTGFSGLPNLIAHFAMKKGWGGKIRKRLMLLVTENQKTHAKS